ncbi:MULTISPECIES: type III secretion effector protein [Pseudomonas]|uniref:type III secretion effector protein n=1 Tax=Pseudomonas TaxID=286 RepID=UPI001BFFF3C3|nr:MULTISPECIES: type III secretion effector protein [Pseudomonas]MBT9300256.1 type III secretion effector protein [Pseudomonas sp. TAE6080]
MKNEGLKLSSLQRIASEKMTDTPALNNAILLARALVLRPRLIDAILDEKGFITRQSLSRAVEGVFGNSDPNAFSSDPFHAKTNVELVQAFRAAFDELRDRSRDRTSFFESVGYVQIERLVSISRDPDEMDKEGVVIRDPATGLPKKMYSEQLVYMSKNLVDRPRLLNSLERIHSGWRRIYGSHYQKGWLSNKDLDGWLENNKNL